MTVQSFQHYVVLHTWDDKDIFFTSNALVGELGELANVIKKEIAAQDFTHYGARIKREVEQGLRPTFRSQFVDEAGDVFFYFMQLLNKYNVTLDEVVAMQTYKINKQSEEYGTPYKK